MKLNLVEVRVLMLKEDTFNIKFIVYIFLVN
jgi:hypothetical protein